MENYYFEDFTEENYRSLLKLCKKNYNFISYGGYTSTGKNVLWRHDIDLSIHRAVGLAKIELEESVKATYFIHLHNEFYNLLEKDVAKCIFKIIEYGHNIGLHFDPNFYSLINTTDNLEYYLRLEKELIEKIFQTKIHVFSFHNPDLGNWLQVDREQIAGMVNTYSAYIRGKYAYCSDSNGYWRFRRLEDVLTKAEDDRLQILTHPGWWVSAIMSPRDRVSRCINGRADAQHKAYDNLLLGMGRKNVGK
jgi:hypothetical protein